jgi:hypothetical protein
MIIECNMIECPPMEVVVADLANSNKPRPVLYFLRYEENGNKFNKSNLIIKNTPPSMYHYVLGNH